jgi:hypothetical protein
VKYGEQIYLGVPPFQQHSATSIAASEAFQPHQQTARERVRLHIVGCGEYGCTRDEIEVALEMPHQTATARVKELLARREIRETTRQRPTRSGRLAFVLVAVVPDEGAQPVLLEAPVKRVYH